MKAIRVLLFSAVLLAAGCPTHFENGEQACDSSSSCPDGWFCHTDNFCYEDGTVFPDAGGLAPDAAQVAPDAGQEPPDASAPDASPAGLDAGPAVLTLDRQPGHDFGEVVVGEKSAADFTVSNAGESVSGTLATELTGAGFSIKTDGCSEVTLAPAASCTISVEFAPTAPGAASGQLSASATPGGAVSSSLTATGLSPGDLEVSPADEDFGSLLLGESKSGTLTVSNVGDAAIGVADVSLGGSDATHFRITGGTCAAHPSLTKGASCTVEVLFEPQAGGDKVATLTATDSAGGSATANLKGLALTPATLELVEATLGFGVVDANPATPPVLFLSLKNTGTQASGALSDPLVAMGDPSFAVVPGGTCVPGAALAGETTCTIAVQFQPLSFGYKAGAVAISATPGGTQIAALAGTGRQTFALTVARQGAGSGGVVDVPQAGIDCTGSPGDCTETYAAASVFPTVTLEAAPADGSLFDSWTGCTPVFDNPARCMVELNADREVIASFGTPAALSLGAASYDFGVVDAGLATPPEVELTLTNSGTQASGPLPDPLATTGDAAFSVVPGGTCVPGGTVAGGSSCTIWIRFAPPAFGVRDGAFSVTATPGGSPSIALTGTGRQVFTLTVGKAGPADGAVIAAPPTSAIDCGDGTTGDCTESYEATTSAPTVTLTAVPGANGALDSWTGCTVGSTPTECTAVMDQDRSVTATFKIKILTLTVTKVGSGTVSGTSIDCGATCVSSYPYGTAVTLTATASSGSFLGWSGDCNGTGTCSFAMTDDRSVTAVFGTAISPSPVASWILNGSIGSSSPFPVTSTAANVTAGSLSKSAALAPSNFASAFVADGWPSGGRDETKYFEFSSTAATGYQIKYDSVRFSLYNNFDGVSTWEVRSSVDGYATALATGSVSRIFYSGVAVNANVSSLGIRRGTVTFRVYTYNNSGDYPAQQRGFRGSYYGGTDLNVWGAVY